ncbi:MAG: hypothetical protein ACR2QC_05720 [Gammaproteobacteria bacterium]
MRFRLSPEWRVLFVFADNTECGGIRKYKKTAIPAKVYPRERGDRNLFNSIPAKAGISSP